MSSGEQEATDRLSRVGDLVVAARDELKDKIGRQGLVVAVVVKTFDGVSIHAALAAPTIAGSGVTTDDFVDYLHAALDIFTNKLPKREPSAGG